MVVLSRSFALSIILIQTGIIVWLLIILGNRRDLVQLSNWRQRHVIEQQHHEKERTVIDVCERLRVQPIVGRINDTYDYANSSLRFFMTSPDLYNGSLAEQFYASSWRSSPSADFKLFQEFANRLTPSEGKCSYSIFAFGGSETAGVNCFESPTRTLKQCSWPSRVAKWLQDSFPTCEIQLTNLARGGTTALSIIPALSSMLRSVVGGIDLVFLDFDINDGSETKNIFGRTIDLNSTLAIITEVVIREITYYAPKATIIALQQPFSYGPIGSVEKAQVYSFYDIPHISPLDALTKQGQSFRPTVGGFAEEGIHVDASHPDFIGHEWLANFFTTNFRVIMQRYCPNLHVYTSSKLPDSLWSQNRYLSRIPFCRDNPLFLLDAYEPKRQLPAGSRVSFNNVAWEEQRAGKPGYMFHGNGSSMKIFNMRTDSRLGDEAFFSISYLRSYETVGDAFVNITTYISNKYRTTITYWLRGRSEGHVSQTFTEMFRPNIKWSQTANEFGNSGALGLNYANTVDIEITLFEPKTFKIIEILSC